MISLLFFIISIVAGATLYGDNLLVPIAIVALVTTLTLIFYPTPSLSESLIVLTAVTVWYAGAVYLLRRAYVYFVQK